MQPEHHYYHMLHLVYSYVLHQKGSNELLFTFPVSFKRSHNVVCQAFTCSVQSMSLENKSVFGLAESLQDSIKL